MTAPIVNPRANPAAFVEAAKIMDKQLAASTNLKPLERKIVAYWTLGTHALHSVQWYPLLQLHGPTNTGKTSIEKTIFRFAFKPAKKALKGMTNPVLRDFLAEHFEGTVILEEADHGARADSNAHESLLSNRVSRDTSQSAVKRPKGANGWGDEPLDTFGATVVHCRFAFADAALDTRTIKLTTRPKHDRNYVHIADDEENYEGKGLLTGLKIDALPKVDLSSDNIKIGNRVLNNYGPLLSAARLLGDEDFIKDIITELRLQQAELVHAQQSEPTLLILQAIVGIVLDPEQSWRRGQYLRSSKIRDRIWEENRQAFNTRQITSTARDMGIKTTIANGQSKVIPDLMALIAACQEYGYEGEDIDQLKQLITPQVDEVGQNSTSPLYIEGGMAISSTSSTADGS